MSGTFVHKKRQLLKEQLNDLIEEYEAANQQLARVLSDIDRVRIQRQINDIEARAKAIQKQLDDLE